MVITDYVSKRTFVNDILTVEWKKSGSFSYKKTDGYWYNICGIKVEEKTNDFLEKQFKRATNG